MQHIATLPWHNPLAFANTVSTQETHFAFLYSGMASGYSGQYSFLALYPNKEVKGEDFTSFASMLSSHAHPYTHACFGYLGYGLKNALETLPHDIPLHIHMPSLWMTQYAMILVFDHQEKQIDVWADSSAFSPRIPLPSIPPPMHYPPPSITTLHSNMTKAQYLEHVKTIKQHITYGTLYQANLTRKFYGTFHTPPDAFALFCRLSHFSPSPYSAFLRLGEYTILSSSPERFLHIDAKGTVDTRPIKGSSPRYHDPKKDLLSSQALAASQKNKAENLMIVDLSRNDLSRSCQPGSIHVPDLFSVHSYTTIHHMQSTITGQKRPDKSTLDTVKGCFPPGSMTGTPKIKAMELCSALEYHARGVYAGALGWFGGDGSADLSVVIRTLLLQHHHFEFQVGGAIIADSDPVEEWKETLIKAKAIAKTLGITQQQLKTL